jgi:F-type H+-transporting ATPase subunit epsilon
MAEATFTFRLVTPQRLVLEAPVVALQVPGSEGYLGVLAHHAPLITALRPGRLEVRDESGKRSTFAVGGGFLEVSGNRATVLADSAELASEIVVVRETASLQRAEQRLKGDGGASPDAVDRERATRAMERAKNRLALVISERA